MKTIIPVFFHILCTRYPHLFRMAEPKAVKNKRVIPVDDQPDQVRIPKSFPERICSIKLFQNKSKDKHKNKQCGSFPNDVRPCNGRGA